MAVRDEGDITFANNTGSLGTNGTVDNPHHDYYGWDSDYTLDDYYGIYNDHVYEIFSFEVPIYGYIWPILVLLTTCSNFIVIGAFLRKRMRSPTSTLLIFIAISDSLTGLVTLPATFHVFTNKHILLSKDWCDTVMITRLYISRALHTISVWQTLLLGIFRYLQVRKPVWAERFCTLKKTLLIIAGFYVCSFVLHSYHAVDIKSEDGWCVWKIEDPCGWTCFYIWCTLLFAHIVPCVALLLLAISMMRTLNQLNTNLNMDNTINRRKERNRKLTLVVVLVVLVFLIPELPYGIYYVMIVGLRHSNKNIFPLRTNRIVHSVYELILVLSFHLNFWVYCLVIRSFRNLLKSMLRFVTCRPVSFDRLDTEESSGNADYELAGVGRDDDEE